MRNLKQIAQLLRYYILSSTTKAGSGHPTSCLSAVELMAGLLFSGVFKYNLNNPNYSNNDRLIFSKGHSAPLLYALYCVAGAISEKEIMTLRKFNSRLEGHPTMRFPWCEAPTGSLGQGLSIGLGMALNGKYLDKLPYRVYVLLGDSEMSEGSVWEAMQIASHYKLNNLIGIIDVNRLGQRGQTMLGHNVDAYKKRVESFGWRAIVIDGHSFSEILRAYKMAAAAKDRPFMIIAKTIKGKGVCLLEDKEGWHGKPLSAGELKAAIGELGKVDLTVKGKVYNSSQPPLKLRGGDGNVPPLKLRGGQGELCYKIGEMAATRKAYGNALVKIAARFPNIVALDAETSNSTGAELFKNEYPDRFFEMYIAEQNMVGAGLGLALRGKIPFISTFAAFLTRAHDQIRMARYAGAHIIFCGSHGGVSIGEDGPSQMGLEDLAMFRSILGSVVLYPADAVAMKKLVDQAARHKGMVYIRATRNPTPVLYKNSEAFPIGGCKILRQSAKDKITIIGAGITVFEALAAYEDLKKQGIMARVIDLYCVKPLDISALRNAATQTRAIITVEDHFAEGGLGEAVQSALACEKIPVYGLAVRKTPQSGKTDELLDYEEISKKAIVRLAKKITRGDFSPCPPTGDHPQGDQRGS